MGSSRKSTSGRRSSPSGSTAPLCLLRCALWSERPASSTLLLWITSLVRLYSSYRCLLCVLSGFLKDFFPHRFAVSPGCHHIRLGESVGGSAVHLGSGTSERSFCGVQSCIFRLTTRVLNCGLWCVCVSVRSVCRPAQCCSKFGDCFLLACVRCGWPGLSGSWVGVCTKFQVIKYDALDLSWFLSAAGKARQI